MRDLSRYSDFLADAKSSSDYWCEVMKVEFAAELGRWMDENNISRAQLARKTGVTPAYITKALGGNVNFTIASMVKLAMALGGALHIHMSRQDAVAYWMDDIPTSDQTTVFRPNNLGAAEARAAKSEKMQIVRAVPLVESHG